MTRKFSRNYSLSVVAPFIAVGPRFGSTKLAAAAIRGAVMLAVIYALVLIAARPAQAQTETVLYNFCSQPNCSDGGSPYSNLTFDGAGNLYGTTQYGGLGYGTVFQLSPNGSGGWNYTVLYSFTGVDGANPMGPVIFDGTGNLYGTTFNGGLSGLGAVFELSPVRASWTETVLYSFTGGTDGAGPGSGVIMDGAGNLYGTTKPGPLGVVFELSPSGGSWTLQVICPGCGGSSSGLTWGVWSGIWAELFFIAEDIEAVELAPNGNGGWYLKNHYSFPSSQWPVLGTPYFWGALYGTTYYGGTHNYGTVYRLDSGNRDQKPFTERIVYSFTGRKDGAYPLGGVVNPNGNFYGTTEYGGKFDKGTVFELAGLLSHRGYKEHVLWSFNVADGEEPSGNVTLDSAGNLYGTTEFGGSSGSGVVFEVSGVRVATETTLYSSPNPSTYGQAVTFTAAVCGETGCPPDGETVTFKEGTKVLGTGLLSGTWASFTTSTLPVGTHAIKAVYGGDLHFLGSTSKAVNQVVN